MQIILASTSIYRRQILSQLGLAFHVIAPICDETPYTGENARETAARLARTKAKSQAEHYPAALIIGSDQVAWLDGQQIGKPRSIEHGIEILTRMSGRTVVFYAALALFNTTTHHLQETVGITHVTLRTITENSARRYLNRAPEALNCTGSAQCEGIGNLLIEKIDTHDPNALIGMPLFDLVTMLMNEGVELFDV